MSLRGGTVGIPSKGNSIVAISSKTSACASKSDKRYICELKVIVARKITEATRLLIRRNFAVVVAVPSSLAEGDSPATGTDEVLRCVPHGRCGRSGRLLLRAERLRAVRTGCRALRPFHPRQTKVRAPSPRVRPAARRRRVTTRER